MVGAVKKWSPKKTSSNSTNVVEVKRVDKEVEAVPLEAGKLFMIRSQLEKEGVTEFTMHLKRLFKQVYSEEDSTSGIHIQRFVMGLKTPVSSQLLLRGKLESFENAIEVVREIECVLEFKSKAVELRMRR